MTAERPEPRTEAGRALLAMTRDITTPAYPVVEISPEYLADHILRIEAGAALPVPALDALLQEVGRVAVTVANDWMGDPDHGFILDRLVAPVEAWRAALGSQEEPR